MCMAIYNNGSDTICQYFEIGNLNSVKRGFDFLYKIGFKTNSTTCAFNDTASGGGYLMGYNETLRRSTYNGWDFKYDEVSENWIFESTGVTMCPASGWKLSLYPSGKNAEITHAQAVGNCSSKNSDSHISGVETQEEYDYLITRAEGLGWQTWPLLKAAWLDGTRKPECVGNSSCQGITAFQFTDPLLSENPKGYLWNPNQPDGLSNDCLAFIVNPDRSYGIEDELCTRSRSADNQTPFVGYACGSIPKVY
ncbi:hypothetical protein L3Y34_016407 [Caenorhabditis briggsae]|uniref:C-type lectin domain-containing protein n=1 Tax=Caenorhabditis briggsae TaxID=6238 RepID=A0AAE9DZ87_CAEBR|nr:hypothetical protein L3Y34_016407 [Caenorhabditis briggsae]